jgi:hypothetical protein
MDRCQGGARSEPQRCFLRLEALEDRLLLSNMGNVLALPLPTSSSPPTLVAVAQPPVDAPIELKGNLPSAGKQVAGATVQPALLAASLNAASSVESSGALPGASPASPITPATGRETVPGSAPASGQPLTQDGAAAPAQRSSPQAQGTETGTSQATLPVDSTGAMQGGVTAPNDSADDSPDPVLEAPGSPSNAVDDGPDILPPLVAPERFVVDDPVMMENEVVSNLGGPGPTDKDIGEVVLARVASEVAARLSSAQHLQTPPVNASGTIGDTDPFKAGLRVELSWLGQSNGPEAVASCDDASRPVQELESKLPDGSPVLAGLLGDILPLDPIALERGLQHFLDELNMAGEQMVQGATGSGRFSWFMLATVTSVAAVELARRHLKHPSPAGVMGCTDEDSTWNWLANVLEPRRGIKP